MGHPVDEEGLAHAGLTCDEDGLAGGVGEDGVEAFEFGFAADE